jgi:hypothetical protein
MNFKNWIIEESSLVDLYNSTVQAFPNCTLRQHATQTISIADLTWVPYKGMKTLFIKALAQNEGKEYNSIILFKRVKYIESGGIKIVDNIGQQHFIEQLSLNKTDVLIRCNCLDFFYRFNYYDHLDKSLYGPKRTPYKAKGTHPPANPTKSEGLCKHLIKMMEILQESGIVG